jgi:hypothetical protein
MVHARCIPVLRFRRTYSPISFVKEIGKRKLCEIKIPLRRYNDELKVEEVISKGM